MSKTNKFCVKEIVFRLMRVCINYEGEDPGFELPRNGTTFGDPQNNANGGRKIVLYGSLTSLGDRLVLQYLFHRSLCFEIQRIDIVLLENFDPLFSKVFGSEGGVPIVTVDGVVVTPTESDGASDFQKQSSVLYLNESVKTCAVLDQMFFTSTTDPFVVLESVGFTFECGRIFKELVLFCMENFLRPNNLRAKLWKSMLEAKDTLAKHASPGVRSSRYEQQLKWGSGDSTVVQDINSWLDWLDTRLQHSKHGFASDLSHFSISDAFCAIVLNKLAEIGFDVNFSSKPFLQAYFNGLCQNLSYQTTFCGFNAWEIWPSTRKDLYEKAMSLFQDLKNDPSSRSQLCKLSCFIDPFTLSDNAQTFSKDDPESVIQYWIRPGAGLRSLMTQLWFCKNPIRKNAIDRIILNRWGSLVEKACKGELSSWEGTTRGLLALIIMLDQWTRHLFSGSKKYSFDLKALEYSKKVLESSQEFEKLSLSEKFFVLLPFEHSEDTKIQRMSDNHFRDLMRNSKSLEQRFFYAHMYYKKLRHEEVLIKYSFFPSRAKERGENIQDVPELDLIFN